MSDDNGSGAPTQSWTLSLDVWTDGSTVYFIGDLVHDSNPAGGTATVTTYQGGWSYSDFTGPIEDSGSDPGFHDTAAAMFNVVAASNAATAQGLSTGSILQMISNIIKMGIYYVRNLSQAWSTPTSCDGPKVRRNAGQTCEDVNITCRTKLDDLCLKIGELTSVSEAFKKCMKGRCSCGGSKHPRSFIDCGDQDECGPCGAAPPLTIIYGCNIAGAQEWYCRESANSCKCVNAVFHEMSHACGALDLRNGAPLDAHRIGDWFQAQYEAQFGACP